MKRSKRRDSTTSNRPVAPTHPPVYEKERFDPDAGGVGARVGKPHEATGAITELLPGSGDEDAMTE